MDSAFTIGQHDTASPWRLKLRGDPTPAEPEGEPVDIAGASIHFTIRPIQGGDAIVDHAGNNLQVGDGIANGTRGDVSYGEAPNPWGTATEDAGYYVARVTVTFANGDVVSYPNAGHLLMVVDAVAPAAAARYLTLDQLKDTLEIKGQYANRDIETAIEAASRGLEIAYGAVWTLGTDPAEVRYYSAADEHLVPLGDVIKATEVAVDYPGWTGWSSGWSGGWASGEYATILSASDYRLEPFTNGLLADGGNGEPFQQLVIKRGGTWRGFPGGADGVRITGQFGWERVPAGVTAAATIIATRLLRRVREAPFGVHGVGLDQQTFRAVTMARDPEIEIAIAPARGPVRLFA